MLSPETADAFDGLRYVGLPLAVDFNKKYLIFKEKGLGIRNSKFVGLLWELEDDR